MDAEKLTVQCGFRGLRYIFYLNMISMEDEQAYMDRLGAVTPDTTENRDKSYAVLVDGIKAWSWKMPDVFRDGTKKAVPIAEEGTSIAEAIDEEFGTREKIRERILNTTIINYRIQMSPTVDFL